MSILTELSNPLAIAAERVFRPVVRCATCSEEITDLEDALVTYPLEGGEINITHRGCGPGLGTPWMPLEYFLLKLFLASGMGEINEGEEGTTVTITLPMLQVFVGGL